MILLFCAFLFGVGGGWCGFGGLAVGRGVVIIWSFGRGRGEGRRKEDIDLRGRVVR